MAAHDTPGSSRSRPGTQTPRGRDHGPDRRRIALGDYGERTAVRHLREQGLAILDRNWRCADGELDIVAREGDCLVVCEVKTRRTLDYGSPLEAITWRKAARLRRLAGWWIEAHPEVSGVTRRVRVDVVGVLLPYRGAPQIEHLAGVL